MSSALQVIRSQGPKFLRQLYRENVKPVVGAASEFFGPEGLAAAALTPISAPVALATELLLAPSELYEHADKPGDHPGARQPHKDFRPSNLPLSRNAGWSDARAEVARQLNADREAAYEKAFAELMAKYPSPSVVIANPEINTERAAARRRLFSDEEALATLLGTRAEELMPQRFAAGGAVKRLAKRYFDPDQDVLPTTNIVKDKGGNWLSGSVEDALRPLVPKAGATDRSANSVMEEMLRTFPADKLNMMSPDTRQTVDAAFARLRPQVAVQNWIEGTLAKYVKTRMASPEDEVRKLAEQGVLHFDPETLGASNDILLGNAAASRARAGTPVEGLAVNPVAKRWEAMSDAATGHQPAKRRLDFELQREQNPWLEKIDPDTPTYHFNNPTGGLGFPHLIDELSNALNPASGLPRNLLLTPEAVQQMSMEKAVRRVADINAWRAAQKVEANRKLAEHASLVREYPHSDAIPNPKGLRWVELKAGEHTGDIPANFIIDQAPTGPTRMPFGVRIDEGGGMSRGLNNKGFESREKAEESIRRYLAKQELEAQLKYEGDTMGHCVGGYCDDVLSGRSRIFSLRDTKGEPHVTVEVEPMNEKGYYNSLPSEERHALLNKAIEHKRTTQPDWDERADPVERAAMLKEYLDAQGIQIPSAIKQIKGKQNRKPNDEYLPFVQDFVRNSPLGGSWSDVGDLQNAGLRRITEERLRNELGDYVTEEEWARYMSNLIGGQ